MGVIAKRIRPHGISLGVELRNASQPKASTGEPERVHGVAFPYLTVQELERGQVGGSPVHRLIICILKAKEGTDDGPYLLDFGSLISPAR